MKKITQRITGATTAVVMAGTLSACEKASDPNAQAFADKASHAGALVLNAEAIVRDGCTVEGEGSTGAAGEKSGNAILKLGPTDKIVITAPKGGFEVMSQDVTGNNGEHIMYRHWVKLPKEVGQTIATQMDWNGSIHKDPVGSSELLKTLIDKDNFEEACVGDNYEFLPPKQ